jgi:hypothetical protein
MNENEIVYSNLGTKYGTNRCCQEAVVFNNCDCATLGFPCNPGAAGYSGDLSIFGLAGWIISGDDGLSFAGSRCAHSDDVDYCLSSPPTTLIPMAADCGGQLTGEARRIDSYNMDNGNCDAYNFCPDGRCRGLYQNFENCG